MSNNAKTSDNSVIKCEKGDCGESDCEKCRETLAPNPTTNMEECMGRSMETLSNAFRASARRWEMIVYPSLVAFIILAAYGFYLIYSLTKDAHQIATNMTAISNNMLVVSERMVVMSDTVEAQSASMREMVTSMHNMNVSMNQMRQDMSVMNYNVSRPMNKINSFMPW